MPDTPTTRLGLYKSLSDGSELVDYSQDIGQNLDKIDAAVGFASCTASTRPSAPYSGKGIFQTDTSYSTYFSNGTSPASGSWVEIPNSSSTFGSNLKLASGKQLNIGASNSSANIAILTSSATDDVFSTRLTGDTQSRFLIDADGTLNWGAGGASTTDVNLYRSAANTLRTADNLTVDLGLTVTGNATVNGVLTAKNRVVGTVTITPSAANTPTSQAVTFPAALTGSTFYGVACAATTVPGTQVTGVGIASESSTGCTLYVTRTNTTATIIRYIVEGF